MPASSRSPSAEGRKENAIVFDPETATVSTSKVKDIVGQWKFRQPVPRWNRHVDIWIGSDDETKRVVATLNLDGLGWATNVQRAWGRFGDIYVMSPDVEA